MLVNYTNCSIHLVHHLLSSPEITRESRAPSVSEAAHHSEAAPRQEVRARGDEAWKRPIALHHLQSDAVMPRLER